ncbi:MAG: hypothetical protein ACI9SX_000890 [Pseudoalteromonas tetraodonis]
MKASTRSDILNRSWEIHAQIESSYLDDRTKKGDTGWKEKQRILLADMAIHLLQTALNPEEIDCEKLTNNIHAILTITDQFLPDAELKTTLEKLY